MVHGFLQAFDSRLEVCSAGTKPAEQVHPKAVEVMYDLGIDLSPHKPKLADRYLNQSWDYVITVCDHAKETCPAFLGKVSKRLHMGFEDPSLAVGSEAFIHSEFCRVRDEIRQTFQAFYENEIKSKLR